MSNCSEKLNIVYKHAQNMHEEKRYSTAMRATRVECVPLLIGKAQIGKIDDAQRDLAIEEFYLRCVVVERK